ncbi:response regulator transcription factor (plasmid) [Curtobacterium sp. MCBD17_040]|nr:response regulator transcription factor [Curtobacterium sp. MCBD17_040]WIB65971.1 response regulator transcription factor [Curtobacterium sp. MCBD17_040]
MTAPITVGIVDDQRLFASGMSMLVNAQPDMTSIGSASDGEEALALVRRADPDVLLLDLRMPVLNGIDTMRQLFADTDDASAARPKIVVLTTMRNDDAVLAALRAGAGAFLTKDATPDVVLDTIRAVHQQSATPSEADTIELLRTTSPVADDRNALLDRLTAREQEVFLLVAKGLSNAQIAATLFLSDATVKTHVRAVLNKLGLRNRIQVVITAHERGLVRAQGGKP